MSGQPVLKPGDANKYFNEYMNMLNLEASINDMNLQANKNFNTNGILPAVSAMKDNRTTTEMLADIEKLKTNVAATIAKVSNMQFGTGVVTKIMASPLNIDNKLIVFMAQRGPEFIVALKKNYSIGIKGDINDVDVMVLHIEDFYNKTVNTMKSVKGYIAENSRYNVAGSRNSIINGDNINAIMRDVENITIGLMSKFSKGKVRGWSPADELLIAPVLHRLRTLISAVRRFAHYGLPSNELIEQAREIMIDALDDRENGVVGAPNERLLDEATDDITEQYNDYLAILEALPKPSVASIYTVLSILEEKIKAGSVKGFADSVEALENLFAFVYERNLMPSYAIRKLFDEVHRVDHYPPRAAPRARVAAPALIAPAALAAPIAPYVAPAAPVRPIHPFHEAAQIVEPHVAEGEGLRRGKRSNFRGFGLAEINHKKLESGVLSIRRPSKGNYKTVPQQRISETFSRIVKDMHGGRVPNFDDINSLTSDEKEYLHRVVSASGFSDKLSVPSPDKDAIEKEIHTFDVMKGEILAGNDSKALIKKFKMLILKLSNKGSLPKKESNEVLYQLLSLGY